MVESVFDLDAFGLLDFSVCKIHKPGKPEELTGLEIKLASTAHPQFAKFLEDAVAELRKEQEEREMAKEAGKEIPAKPFSLEEKRKEAVRVTAARVIEANQKIKFRGEVIDLCPENALEVLSDPHHAWMTAQLVKYVEDTENFMPPSV